MPLLIKAQIKRTWLARVVLCWTALFVAPAHGDDVTVVPDWTGARADGTEISYYDDTRGDISVLIFWATWCPYCQRLLPHIEKVRQSHEGKRVQFYALNIWEDGDPVAYFERFDLNFQLVVNADSVAKTYGIKGTPGLLVVDPDYHLIYSRPSGEPPEVVAASLTKILGESLP